MLEQHYGDDLDRICVDHENLIKTILEEEEELISTHRTHVDNSVDIVKKDMELLHNVDLP
jgi:kinesin family protein 2/24